MVFALTNVLLVVLVWRLLPLVAPEGGPWTWATGAFVLAMAVATGIPLVLGLLQLLAWPAVLLTLVAALAAVLVAERRVPVADPPAVEPVTSPLTTLVGAMLGASLGVWFGRPGWSGTGFCFDDITYHAAIPSQWLQWGAIDYVPFSYQAYYALNSELLSLWFMVPTGDPTHASLAVLLFVGLIVCGTLSMSETHDVPPHVTMAIVATMFASHRVLDFSRTFSSTDLAMTAYIVAALAFALRPPSVRMALWCGLAGGLAIGTKVSAIPPMAVVGLWWLVRARKGRVDLPLVYTLGLLAFGSYWYVRNLVHTGNPVFPAEIGPFEGPFEPETARRTALIHYIEAHGHELEWWIDMVYGRLNWPEYLGIASMVGYVVALVAGFRSDRRGLWLVAAVGLVFLALFPMQPFSATINRPSATLHSLLRYLTLTFVLGLPLVAGMVRRPGALAYLVTGTSIVGFGVAVYAATSFAYGTADVLWLLAGASIALVCMGLTGGTPRWVAPAIAVTAVLVVAARTPQKRERTHDRLTTFSPMGTLHKPAWAFLDGLPDGSSVAWMADMPPSHGFNLPLLGDRLQFTVVPVDPFGQRQDRLLHERWRDEPEHWWWQFDVRAGSDVPVMTNLLRSGADYLMLSRCQRSSRGGWPRPHQGLLATDPDARIFNDACVEIWELDALRDDPLVEPEKKPKKRKDKKDGPPPFRPLDAARPPPAPAGDTGGA
ncbi:MAG: hypothetical protein R3F61_14110 [Myxococcota bacterium]